jgi:hypothetical protein
LNVSARRWRKVSSDFFDREVAVFASRSSYHVGGTDCVRWFRSGCDGRSNVGLLGFDISRLAIVSAITMGPMSMSTVVALIVRVDCRHDCRKVFDAPEASNVPVKSVEPAMETLEGFDSFES